MSDGHSLFQWMPHCPGGYLGHKLPPKARLSLEMVDATDDTHPGGLILSCAVLGTCLPAGMPNTQSCSFPCSFSLHAHVPHPNLRCTDGVTSNPHMDEKLLTLFLTLHKGQLATEYT